MVTSSSECNGPCPLWIYFISRGGWQLYLAKDKEKRLDKRLEGDFVILENTVHHQNNENTLIAT